MPSLTAEPDRGAPYRIVGTGPLGSAPGSVGGDTLIVARRHISPTQLVAQVRKPRDD